MKLNFIPLAAALLPTAAVHLCYLLAAASGHVPWCLPYVDGCASISATGRESPESHVFRATIIPSAVLLMVYWRLCYAWLGRLGSRTTVRNRGMLCLGTTAGLGLILYTSVLGAGGETYEALRRVGVTLFYAFTFLAQLLMTGQIAVLVRTRPGAVSAPVYRGLAAICAAISILGIISLLSWAYYEDHRGIEDAFEWGLTLLIFAHLFVTHFAWRDSGFEARFTVLEK